MYPKLIQSAIILVMCLIGLFYFRPAHAADDVLKLKGGVICDSVEQIIEMAQFNEENPLASHTASIDHINQRTGKLSCGFLVHPVLAYYRGVVREVQMRESILTIHKVDIFNYGMTQYVYTIKDGGQAI